MSIIKKDNKKGTYYFVISAGKYDDGRRRQIRRSGFVTEKEAIKEYNRIKNEIFNDDFVDKSSTTLGEHIDKWLRYKKNKVTNATYTRYERICRLNILPRLGRLQLQKINQQTIQSHIDYLSESLRFSKKTCYSISSVLKDIFHLAIRERIVKENPVHDIDFPSASEKQFSVWDSIHIRKFISLKDDPKQSRYYDAVLIALLTGLRKGEVLGLSWDNIELDEGIIYITQILESDGKRIAQRTKNRRFRQVLIPALLKDVLSSIKDTQKKTGIDNPENLVFTTRTGKRVIPNTLNDVLNSICKKYDLPRIKFHELRHTHATMLLKENINIKLIQERLGHSKISTTLDIYSHVLPSMQHIIAEKLDEIIKM